MTMTFDAAVAEYLHRTNRTRPWTQRQEEDALDGLSGWLHARATGTTLQAVTPQVVQRYADERALSADELDDLRGTLASLFLWARSADASTSRH